MRLCLHVVLATAAVGWLLNHANASNTFPVSGQTSRKKTAYETRRLAALDQLRPPLPRHRTNGDEVKFPGFIGNFHKTLPHNDLGEVNEQAYKWMRNAVLSGSYDKVSKIPRMHNSTATLADPLGAFCFNMEGPDSFAMEIENPPPSVSSRELAYQYLELVWMALLRDVPFSEYHGHPLVAEAVSDLEILRPQGVRPATADTLFRSPHLEKVNNGPIVSQFLLQSFNYDGIAVDPKIAPARERADFLTLFEEWKAVQDGTAAGRGADIDADRSVYPRTARDLGRVAGSDAVFSTYFRAALQVGIDGFESPYGADSRVNGFVGTGFAQYLGLVAKSVLAARHAWYHKWQVHRFLRPEAYGGLVHNVMTGRAQHPIDELLLKSKGLKRLGHYNAEINLKRFGTAEVTYLLPQMSREGSPTHPSFPGGHAIFAGAGVTILKALVDESREFDSPVQSTPDGQTLQPAGGVRGKLTWGAELNKLCDNLSRGRDMSGIHWYADEVSGNLLGEEIAIRLLEEFKRQIPRDTVPSNFYGFTLTKFDGTTITI
mmetsp:Transcript_3143/g.9588  ORF Transcript_3143/g.9588 Transcript_3143/m.9588 type:complete len:544 (-) Transcript_3143:34-1665(-)|eukprot:CAMPEP_0198734756 /NCGR_PEP_ID=MMETSP1475-20131203/55031_1 /TAXON_ID= ORGANISM="Unidentified sp., Strain CCMP1999" /NCGR_SAMPLE_ID=MMETSP1475 /ASSEMBLY_ACC=CAM_ASM_001111 /LENGTH=543 /DNA_ID=CAMNT_0044498293 /DNA_START=369 /DNA_END=2000 /DNA_ORIENTATION=-